MKYHGGKTFVFPHNFFYCFLRAAVCILCIFARKFYTIYAKSVDFLNFIVHFVSAAIDKNAFL